jgi:hypothetical protein
MSTNIHAALLAVMADVGAVRKSEKNTAQGFNFRGIDNVTNAVYPAFVKHGVFVTPQVLDHAYEVVAVGAKQSQMTRVMLEVAFTFHAADGSSITSTVRAEAMDSGDKATAKAMSVALRTCLLQTLMLPTDETDPDHDSYERGSGPVAAPQKPTSRSMAPASSTGALNKSQVIWGEKQARKMSHANLLDAARKITGRALNTLDDLTADDVRRLLPALSSEGAGDE